eukprot:598296-Amphidinium_carterae.1
MNLNALAIGNDHRSSSECIIDWMEQPHNCKTWAFCHVPQASACSSNIQQLLIEAFRREEHLARGMSFTIIRNQL